MKLRNSRILVVATALLTAPLLPAWAQAPVHPHPQPAKKAPPKGEVIIKSDTPIDQGDPQTQQAQQSQPTDQGTAQGTAPQGQTQAPQTQGGTATPQDQGQTDRKSVG